jgi:urease accessory protein
VNVHDGQSPYRSADLVPSGSRLQRVEGEARVAVKQAGGRPRIDRLHQAGAAKIRFPRSDGDAIEAVLINTAGGLTGGDRLAWTVEAGPGARVTATTQACEKAYRSQQGSAEVRVALKVGDGASLSWLPQETILYERSSLSRVIDADVALGGRLLLCEATIFGRKAHGESLSVCAFRDRWRIGSGGRLVHAEDAVFGPDVGRQLAARAMGAGAGAIATLLLVEQDAGAGLDRLRDIIGDEGGASAWRVGATGKLLARIVAADGRALRRRLVPALELLNGKAGLPKAWSI